MQTL
jgi:hypothetical protein